VGKTTVSSRGRSRREVIKREAFSAIAAYESCVSVAATASPHNRPDATS
jgi:hypothetical protein